VVGEGGGEGTAIFNLFLRDNSDRFCSALLASYNGGEGHKYWKYTCKSVHSLNGKGLGKQLSLVCPNRDQLVKALIR
jgi:hypothetical protein